MRSHIWNRSNNIQFWLQGEKRKIKNITKKKFAVQRKRENIVKKKKTINNDKNRKETIRLMNIG